MQKFAQSFGIEVDEFSKEDLMKLCIEELCEVSGGKIAVDSLLENLATLAGESILIRGTHYLTNGEKYLYLRLKQCLPKLKEWAKKTDCDDEILDCKAYRRMFKERLDSYVLDASKVQRSNGTSQRFVLIDMEKADKFGLNLYGFCRN